MDWYMALMKGGMTEVSQNSYVFKELVLAME